MCIRVVCKQCGKYSWSGCGQHLKGIYANIEKGQHCLCRSWPGVAIDPSPHQPPETSSAAAATTATDKEQI